MRISNQGLSLIIVAGFCGFLMLVSAYPRSDEGTTTAKPAAMLLAKSTQTIAEADATPARARSLPLPPPPPENIAELTDLAEPAQDEMISMPCRTVWAIVTAYCPCRRCCGRHANGITSTGTSAWQRGAAADPGAISYGTRIFVPGYGYTTVDDTGGAMRRVWRQNGLIHIDLRMNYHWQARQWGRKVIKVKIYDIDR